MTDLFSQFVFISSCFVAAAAGVNFFVCFRSFQSNIITNFTTNICEKCASSIWCWDSNSRPSERESLPITTRPGLPPKSVNFLASTSYRIRTSAEFNWSLPSRQNSLTNGTVLYVSTSTAQCDLQLSLCDGLKRSSLCSEMSRPCVSSLVRYNGFVYLVHK